MAFATSATVDLGLFASQPVRTAIVAGGLVAVVSAVVGVFTVIRGQSFAGHALADMGTLGGSGALLVGASPIYGYVGVGVIVSGAMELLGVQRIRSRDVATGIVLGAALGVSALFLYLDTTVNSTTGATVTILFGSLFTVSADTIPAMILLGLGALGATMFLYRPLLLSSISSEIAAARGVSVRTVSLLFLILMGVTVSLCSVVVGTILSAALLIGPAATALRLSKTPLTAMITAAVVGVAATWAGIVLSYESYYWPPAGKGWPVSFFVVAVILAMYLLADVVAWANGRRSRGRLGSTLRAGSVARAGLPERANGG